MNQEHPVITVPIIFHKLLCTLPLHNIYYTQIHVYIYMRLLNSTLHTSYKCQSLLLYMQAKLKAINSSIGNLFLAIMLLQHLHDSISSDVNYYLELLPTFY